MNRTIIALTTGAVLAFASILSVPNASAHEERCVCTSTVPVPPVPPVPPVAPLPPPPPHADRHVETKVIILRPDGKRHVRLVRRVVRIEDHRDGDERMTRDDFIKRAERAFDEHDRNHDGVLDENEREGLQDSDDDSDEIDVPEPPEAPDEDEAPEAPRPPRPPHAPHAPHD